MRMLLLLLGKTLKVGYSLVDLGKMLIINLVKWYRGTYYNATVLGICNFLAPGIWGGKYQCCVRLSCRVLTMASYELFGSRR